MEPNHRLAGVVFRLEQACNTAVNQHYQHYNTTGLEEIQTLLSVHFGQIQSCFDPHISRSLTAIRKSLWEKAGVTPLQQAVLKKLDVLCRTRLGQDVVDPLEKKIDEIEADLPLDCFDCFNRDGKGRVVDPKGQLELFAQRLQTMARDLSEFNLRGYATLNLEEFQTLDPSSSSAFFLSAARLIVDYNFLIAFDNDLRWQDFGSGRTISEAALAGREFLLREGIDDQMRWTDPEGLIYGGLAVEGAYKFKGIVILPPEFQHKKNIHTLIIAPKSLLHLPRCLNNIATLNSLILEKGKLREIPKCVFELTNLGILRIMENKIEHLPGDLSHMTLNHLKVEKNPITDLPRLPRTILSLAFRCNRISTIGPDIGLLTNVRDIEVTQNPLFYLDREIEKCQELMAFFCDQEAVKSLPSTLTNCPKFEKIAAEHVFWHKNWAGHPTLANFLLQNGARLKKIP